MPQQCVATFTVHGRPQQRGSKRAMPTKSGRTLMVDDNKKSRPWMDAVTTAAAEAWNGRDLLQGPVGIVVLFSFKRPKKHFRANGELKESRPYYFTSAPDADKLMRSIGDALTGVVYGDDRQIARVEIVKAYTDSSEGATISVCDLSN